MKFIKVHEYDEGMEKKNRNTISQEEEEETVGPRNFRVLMKLGQGSFGVVYLVEKLTLQKDGSYLNTQK